MLSSGTHGAAVPGAHPVTITIDAEHPRQVVPGDFAGLSFEVGPLRPGNHGVPGYLFSPGNDSLVTLFAIWAWAACGSAGAQWISTNPRAATAMASPGSTTCLRSPPRPG